MNEEERQLYIKSRKAGEPFIGPDILQIAVTHKCNLTCSFCDVRNDIRKEMDLAEISDIFKQFKEIGGKKVVLVGGEPFLRKDIFEIIGSVKETGLKCLVSTNGTLITSEIAMKIVESGLDTLIFSVEGPAELHNKGRGDRAYQRMMKGLQFVRRYAIEKGKDLEMGFVSVVMDSNIVHLGSIVDIGERYGLRFIHFQPLQTDNTEMAKKKTDHPEWVTGKRLEQLRAVLDGLNARNRPGFRVRADSEGIIDYFKGNVREPEYHCYQHYLRMVIKPDGMMWSCTGDIGSALGGIKKLWYSEQMQQERKDARHCKSMCMQRCIYL